METELTIDRDTASRLNLKASQIDNTLYDAFGQRQVSVIYNPLNQYHVIMEVAPEFWQSPETLQDIYVSTAGGAVSGTQSSGPVAGTTQLKGTQAASAASVANDAARNQSANSIAVIGHGTASTGAAVSTAQETMIPLAAFSKFGPGTTPLGVNHQGHFAATTISFNLPAGKSLSDATTAIERRRAKIGMPATVHGSFQGTAQAYQQSLANQPLLILAALLAVYIVLGVLYESYIHPITILTTLPSAGVGAVLALMFFHIEFSIMAMIGVILLIGIVKKNAIMMIDFALEAERNEGLDSRAAIYRACLLRFRPIMMTTMAALFGALPLAIGFGEGSELRRPLGISIVGGLLVSQMLTLFTTPVIYLYLDRFRLWWNERLMPRERESLMKRCISNLRCCWPDVPRFAACEVGRIINVPPPVEAPPAYKESGDWKKAQPRDAIDRGAWWSIYNDPMLDALEKQVEVSNQNLKASEAAYREAVAVVDETRAQRFSRP